MLKKNNILQILSLSYPILTHIAISQNEFKLALLMLGIIAGLFILNRSKQPEKIPNIFGAFCSPFVIWEWKGYTSNGPGAVEENICNR